MQKTRREALDEFLAFVSEPIDDKARTLASDALNRAMHSLATRHRFLELEVPFPYELTLTAQTRQYSLPDWFMEIPGQQKAVNLTRGTLLPIWTPAELQEYAPTAGTSLEQPGTPRALVIGGVTPVQLQVPVTGDQCEVLSNVHGDIDVQVQVAGLDIFQRWLRVTVTLAGVTPVTAGGWIRIDEFSKSYPAGLEPATPGTTSRGAVSLRTANTPIIGLASLLPHESSKAHQLLTVYPTPTVPEVLAIPVQRRPKRLVHDADALPADWWPALFEEMTATWRDNTGEVLAEGALPRPKFRELVALDNRRRPRPLTRPFGGAGRAATGGGWP